jgi:peptidoglycan/xylan/chitin deacetylase (PgdA/CDA1 family)
MPIAIGIDYEDITQIPAYTSLSNPPAIDLDIPALTDLLLRLFDRHDVAATFFVVGGLAQTYPECVRRIADSGHEIASHSQSHRSLLELNGEAIEGEIGQSKRTIEAIIDTDVTGFRAPTCRVDDRVYRALGAAGYQYSSSVMPSLPVPGFYSRRYPFTGPTEVTTDQGTVVEWPLAVEPTVRLPISGAWIRLLGRRYALGGIRRVVARDRPVLTYSHPWEFVRIDAESLPRRTRIRTGDWMVDTFERLLDLDATYCPVGELSEHVSTAGAYEIRGNESTIHSR